MESQHATMNMHCLTSLIPIIAALTATAATEPLLVYETIVPLQPAERFSLKHSDIPFSTRWQKRTESLDVMKSFHVTQCLWVYGTGREFVEKVHALGLGYQGTLNGLQGQEHSTTNRFARGDTSGRHENLDGDKITPPWMVTFGPRTFTGCCNHPAFRELFFKAAKTLLDIGVDSIHVDDWAMNATWVRVNSGVCFCEHCRAGFRGYLKQHCAPDELHRLGIADIATFDYRDHLKSNGVPDAATYRAKFRELPLTPRFVDFQVGSMRAFFHEFRRRLDGWSPKKYIPVSFNTLLTHLESDRNVAAVGVTDFLVGESSLNVKYQTVAEYLFTAKAAEAFGVRQVVSPIPRSTARTRAAIASNYALGHLHLVPWDIYMGSDATGIQPRYFGTREQYGDLYDFIHEHRALFDDYETAAEIGVLVNADALGKSSPAHYCEQLAAAHLPFRLIIAASKYTRVPLREADLRSVRLLVEFSPVESFCDEDRKTLQAAGVTRLVSPKSDVVEAARAASLDVLRVEGPENIFAFLRVNRTKQSTAIHLVNWNFAADGERAAACRNVTLALNHVARWGRVRSATYHQPGRKPIVIKPQRHEDELRLALPQVETWGVLIVESR